MVDSAGMWLISVSLILVLSAILGTLLFQQLRRISVLEYDRRQAANASVLQEKYMAELARITAEGAAQVFKAEMECAQRIAKVEAADCEARVLRVEAEAKTRVVEVEARCEKLIADSEARASRAEAEAKTRVAEVESRCERRIADSEARVPRIEEEVKTRTAGIETRCDNRISAIIADCDARLIEARNDQVMSYILRGEKETGILPRRKSKLDVTMVFRGDKPVCMAGNFGDYEQWGLPEEIKALIKKAIAAKLVGTVPLLPLQP
jgi:hypothetical protein